MMGDKIPFAELVEFPPSVKLEKGEIYDNIPMDVVDGGNKYVQKIGKKVYTGGGSKFSNGDTIFARITPCLENGKIAKVKNLEEESGFGSTEFFVFRAKENISDPDFIYYLAKTNLIRQPAIKSMVGASGRQRADKGVVENILVPKIPLPTQFKIASILSSYDDLIEINLKQIRLLEEKAVLSYKQIRYSKTNWQKTIIGELATVTSSKRIYLSDYIQEGIPFYRSKEIIAKSNFESIHNPLFISVVKYTEIKEKFGVPISGDLLITSVGTIGFIHLVNDDDGDFYFKDGNLIWIRNFIYPELTYFLFLKFRSPEFRNLLNSVAIGSSQKALTIETVKKLIIEIPNSDSLFNFNEIIKTILKFINNLQKQNAKLREARDILLPRLITGEIEV
ncbi:MAG TPA: restriction endonuclease subunit S [Ignavibacteria bacterium]